MENEILYPKFSVRAAFDSGVVDVSDGNYSTKSGRKYQENAPKMQCYDPSGRTVYASNVQTGRKDVRPIVNATKIDATPKVPTLQDRNYWKGRQQPENNQEEEAKKEEEEVDADDQAKGVRRQIAPYNSDRNIRRLQGPPSKQDRRYWKSSERVDRSQQGEEEEKKEKEDENKQAEGMNRVQLKKMAQREGNIHRSLRGRPQVKTATLEIPSELLNHKSFTITVPGDFGVQVENVEAEEEEEPVEEKQEGQQVQARRVVRSQNKPQTVGSQEVAAPRMMRGMRPPSHLGLDTGKEFRDHLIKDDPDAKQNREYWGGKDRRQAVYSQKKKTFGAKNNE